MINFLLSPFKSVKTNESEEGLESKKARIFTMAEEVTQACNDILCMSDFQKKLGVEELDLRDTTQRNPKHGTKTRRH